MNYFNLGRILTPETMGTVSQFTKDHVLDYDMFGNPNKFGNLPLLAHKMSPVILRKRKGVRRSLGFVEFGLLSGGEACLGSLTRSLQRIQVCTCGSMPALPSR